MAVVRFWAALMLSSAEAHIGLCGQEGENVTLLRNVRSFCMIYLTVVPQVLKSHSVKQ